MHTTLRADHQRAAYEALRKGVMVYDRRHGYRGPEAYIELSGELSDERLEEAQGAPLKLLVVAPSWIGDAVLAQPLLSRLRELHPEAAIDVLAPAWCAPIYPRMPEVGRVFDSPCRHGELSLSGRWKLARELAREGYDEPFVLPNSLKSALIPLFAGIPKRTGYKGESRYGIINHRHTLDKARHPRLADRYARLAEEPGGPDGPQLRLPHLTSTPEGQRAARATLGLPPDATPFVFCPGAEYGPAKRWPARHFAALARALAAFPRRSYASARDSEG